MNCPYCQGVILSKNPLAIYCSRRCNEAARKKRKRIAANRQGRKALCGTHSGYVCHRRKGEEACAECLKAARVYSEDRRRENGIGAKSPTQRPTSPCRNCQRMTARGNFCSARCLDRYEWPEIQCPQCESLFTSTHSNQRYCSIPCRKRRSYDLAVERGSAHVRYTGWTNQRQATYQKRRALEKGASTAVRVIPAQIYARDSWTCGLCASPVDQTLSYPHPFSVSLDHIIPISLGGAHDPANLQCAHLRCNLQKGNRVEVGQLMHAQEVGHGVP